MKIGTHNGVFHADDVFAVAVVRLVKPYSEVVRTRDQKVLDSCDVVVDVGGVYSTLTKRFDHHQREGAPNPRPNGIQFSSFGLVWIEYGYDLCGTYAIAEEVERELVMAIDAADNGQQLFDGGTANFKGVKSQSLSAVIAQMNPLWNWDNAPPAFDKAFDSAVGFASGVLHRSIDKALAVESARTLTKQAVARASAEMGNPRILVFDRYCPWQDSINELSTEALFVLFPSVEGTWMVQAVPPSKGSFDMRKPLPEAWAGLRGGDLAALTGVSDAVFCHVGQFIGGAETKEGALALAKLALKG